MITAELMSKWTTIEGLPRESEYDLIRISSECHAEISLAISPDGNRCLILALPTNFSFDFHPVEREKLSLTKIQKNSYVAMTLLDVDFFDLFDDLIVSMHNSIMDIHDVDDFSKEFIKTFHKWSQFFDRDDDERVPDQIIQGMFGELVYLRRLLSRLPASKVNIALKSWRGPYDQGHDFIFEDKNVEVKTRTLTNTSVRIANEDQLDQLEGKGLELAVVAVERNSANGQTLRELTQEVVRLIEDALGDTAIVYTTMSQKKLGPQNLAEYDNITFRADMITTYDCLVSSFPRIVRSQIPIALFGFKYSLNTSELSDLVVEQEEL